MLDLFSFMQQALAGRYTTKCEHFENWSRINVYCGRDFQFNITVDADGYTLKELNGTVINKGTSFVEYVQYLKDNSMLNSGFEV